MLFSNVCDFVDSFLPVPIINVALLPLKKPSADESLAFLPAFFATRFVLDYNIKNMGSLGTTSNTS